MIMSQTEKIWLHGALSETSLAPLLFRIWMNQRSGRLELRRTEGFDRLGFKEGALCLTEADLDVETLLDDLLREELITTAQADNRRSAGTGSKLLPVLHESGHLPAETLWRFLDTRFKQSRSALFDLDEGEYFFHSEPVPSEEETLFAIPTLDFILRGIRMMRNHDLIEAQLPSPETRLEPSDSEAIDRMALNPLETYVLHLMADGRPLSKLYEISLLGKRETRRIVYLLTSLEAAVPAGRTKTTGRIPDISHADLHRLMDAFNRKCAAIFKYLTKEIGPAAPNMLEKCVEEARPRLSPFFQNLRLDPVGRVMPSSVLKAGPSLTGWDTRQAIIHDMNEILAAEILAAKKFLGNEHEAALIRLISRTDD